ncbi:MAG: nucleotidyltransferase family protein [Gammaproteobacteria bacterium]|nr:nucleotidyltransferase family protein [Gammaproteobacteria bacterium]
MPGGAVLLAAGASRRFGSDKRSHVLASGDRLLHTTTEIYLKCFEQVVVVLRPDDSELRDALLGRFNEHAPSVVVATLAHLGMGHSLAAGIATVSDWDYAFVALGDMPFVAASTLARLKRAMRSAGIDAIVQPSYQGKPGHPVGFGNTHFSALQSLSGDTGARKVVKDLNDQVIDVPVSDRGVLHDVDKPTDLNV